MNNSKEQNQDTSASEWPGEEHIDTVGHSGSAMEHDGQINKPGMTKLTQGPLHTCADGDCPCGQILDQESSLVATCRTYDDARRLVACWNACNGISTEDLEQAHLMWERLNVIKEQNKRLLKQHEMDVRIIHNQIIGMQAALIAARTNGAEEGIQWIEVALSGPDLLPDEDDQHYHCAQAYRNYYDYDAVIERD